jgi:hypothetical protein
MKDAIADPEEASTARYQLVKLFVFITVQQIQLPIQTMSSHSIMIPINFITLKKE